jgi:hypothetical protein
MSAKTAILSVIVAVISALLISGMWSVQAASSGTATVTPGRQILAAGQSHYQTLTQRLQKLWRVNPLIANSHNLYTTGWGTPACAPSGKQLSGTAAGVGVTSTEKCAQKCLQGTSWGSPNGLLFCRIGCL